MLSSIRRFSLLNNTIKLSSRQLSTSAVSHAKIVKIKTSKSLPKIYTKTGDGGNSSLYTGERRSKTDAVFSALGAVDELSCHVGLAKELAAESKYSHPFIDQLGKRAIYFVL